MKTVRNWAPTGALTLLIVLCPTVLSAQTEEPLNGANTAWILTSTALVLFMTLPGLALFYAGLVRSKNVLSVLMQCFAITPVSCLCCGWPWATPWPPPKHP